MGDGGTDSSTYRHINNDSARNSQFVIHTPSTYLETERLRDGGTESINLSTYLETERYRTLEIYTYVDGYIADVGEDPLSGNDALELDFTPWDQCLECSAILFPSESTNKPINPTSSEISVFA